MVYKAELVPSKVVVLSGAILHTQPSLPQGTFGGMWRHFELPQLGEGVATGI